MASAPLIITPVADAPRISTTSVDEGTQSSSGLVVLPNSNDGVEVSHFRIAAIIGGTLYLRDGVTTVEVKSGYGLDLDTELRQLTVARRLGALQAGAGGGAGETRSRRGVAPPACTLLCDKADAVHGDRPALPAAAAARPRARQGLGPVKADARIVALTPTPCRAHGMAQTFGLRSENCSSSI